MSSMGLFSHVTAAGILSVVFFSAKCNIIMVSIVQFQLSKPVTVSEYPRTLLICFKNLIIKTYYYLGLLLFIVDYAKKSGNFLKIFVIFFRHLFSTSQNKN